MSNQIFQNLGKKLGIDSSVTQSKALELHRRLLTRGVKGLSSSAEAVICLQLAATLCRDAFDKAACAKLSGMTASKYRSQVQAVAQMLDVNQRVSIRDLAVTHSALAAEKLAVDVLKCYQREGYDVDVSLPLYQSAALLAAACQHKLKLNKMRLLESSGANKKTFDKLVEVLTAVAAKLHQKEVAEVSTEKNHKRQKTLMDIIEDNMAASEAAVHQQPARTQSKLNKQQDSDDDFEEWKRKILLEANGESK
ncbi:Origin recognition complex subunit 6 metazoa/plant [Trinorchestia longiramus]|nr:Origin recognition complex subunit 6 metazoa/plant [Trinorchestia longiramus]